VNLLILPSSFCLLPSAFFLSAIRVTFVEELPKTATGKIQKYILRAQRPAIAPQRVASTLALDACSRFIGVRRSAFSGLARHSLVAP